MCTLIASYTAHMRAAGFSAKTVRERTKLLERANLQLPYGLAEATTEELADFLANAGWSRETRAAYYGHIRGFFAHHADPSRPVGLDWDPSAGLCRPKVRKGVPRPVTNDELADALRRTRQPWRTYILIAAYTGLRAFEVEQLRRQDITADTVTVRNGKGGRQRVVPTHELVWATVRNMPPGLIVVQRTDGRPRCQDYLSRETGRHTRRVGLDDFTLHRCRHWYATMMLRAGHSLRTVQELLGHSSPATTAIYTQVTDEQRRLAIDALPVLIPTPC